jgi:lipopolysaccharide/colanic/teichoic acid biosynthesis glycosyltransferase
MRKRKKHSFYEQWLKPTLDRLLAAVLLLTCFPLLLVIACAVRIGIGSPVLFYQDRPGKDGKLFRLAKFRTMSDSRDSHGVLLSDAIRLTAFGRWLRSTSLDELPELWNILRGEMSFVGPRPLLVEYLDRYSPEQARRHEVKPGLTGLAQVRGRNAISWPEKFAADVEYVESVSLILDLNILVGTVSTVFMRRGISGPSHATMPLFTGNRTEEGSARAKAA